MGRPSVGLIDVGSKTWNAGHIYIKSLVYANSLLGRNHRFDIRLFYKESSYTKDDYHDIRKYISELIPYDDLSNPSPESETTVGTRHSGSRAADVADNRLEVRVRRSNCRIIFPLTYTPESGTSFPKTIGWIPDFQHLHYPEFFSEVEINDRNTHYTMLFEHADCVIVSNEFSRRDAMNFTPMAEKKVRVLPFGFWLGWKWRSRNCRKFVSRYQLPVKYMMFPSQFWVHKNHRFLFDVVARLVEKGVGDFALVCSGSTVDYRHTAYQPELVKFIETHGIQNNIRILGLIPREDQVQLMRGAAAIIQPSLFEGWSAILEEARAMGKKIFASDIPMHREQHPDHCTFFSPTDPDDLTGCLLDAWPDLEKGPDVSAEKEAEIRYQDQLCRFGMEFQNICNSLL